MNSSIIVRKIRYFHSSALKKDMNLNLLKNHAYIDGKWVNAISNKVFEVKNPADGSLIGTVPDMNVEDVELAINTAHDAFKTWSEVPGKDRAHILRKWHDVMVKNSEEVAQIMTSESGKPIRESRGEVAYGSSFIDWFAEEARRINGEIISTPVKSKQIMICKQPIGVVGLFTPWNFPHAMITRKAAAALAAGCSAVVRPSEDTPLTALAIAELAHEAGIPKGVFNVITSNRENAGPIGKLICDNPLVAGISFTGSTEVGKIFYRQCASTVKRMSLELGGHAPFIVFDSANINLAVKGALASKFRNCGQTCVSANRFFVHENLFCEFVDKFKNEISKIVLGNPKHEQVTAGPLVNKLQINKISTMVDDAVKKGAQVIIGGEPAKKHGELFYEPTLLTNVTSDMLCYNEEIFGPVAVCIPFKTEKEVLQIANSVSRGLAGYFYSNDISQIFRVAHQLEVGMVGINEGMISMTETAFGGIKESGLGREGSHYGIDEYVYIKNICLGNLS